MLWITLTPKTIVNWENVKKSVIFIKTIMSNNINFDEEMFSEQFKMFEKIHQQNNEWQIENKWIYIFKIFTDNNHAFSELLKVVEFSFVSPG
jgi:hypothetical protein